MTAPPIRVIKLGGSLLDWVPEWRDNIEAWLDAQPHAANVLIVGGGSEVDQLREHDRTANPQLPTERIHWLAIQSMCRIAELVAPYLGASLVTDMEQLRLAAEEPLEVLHVERFLREDQTHDNALPCGWEVTSDSIAARVASVLDASELVLLKSSLPATCAREEWCRAGYVDEYFLVASRWLQRVRAVNLRAPGFPQVLAE